MPKNKLPWDMPPSNRNNSYRERPRSKPSAALYHTWRWTQLSRAFRIEHPLCEECKRRGRLRPATCVDHIEPWPICGEQGFFDRANLQALCNDCNNRKGQRDKKRIQAWEQAQQGGTPQPAKDRTPHPAKGTRKQILTRKKY